jgi:hypothetical protein
VGTGVATSALPPTPSSPSPFGFLSVGIPPDRSAKQYSHFMARGVDESRDASAYPSQAIPKRQHGEEAGVGYRVAALTLCQRCVSHKRPMPHRLLLFNKFHMCKER